MSLVAQLAWEYQHRFERPEFLWALKYDPAQPRDKSGRWVSGYGDLLSAISKPDGGFTYSPTTKTSPTSGHMVSIYKGRELVLDVQQVTGVTLARYVRQNRDLLRYRRNYLGVWHNPENGKVYLDISRRTSTKREAARLGKRHDQEAYFDLRAGKSVPLKAKKHEQETDTPTDRRTDTGGSRQADEGSDRSRTDPEGNRGDEESPLRTYAEVLKYDPRQLRDEHGRWAKGSSSLGSTYLHGTTQQALEDIIEHGILGSNAGLIHPKDRANRTLSLPGHVYMTTDEDEAKAYAESAGVSDAVFNKNLEVILNPVYEKGSGPESSFPFYLEGTEIGGGRPAVVTVELPPRVVKKLRKDRRSDIMTGDPYGPTRGKRVLSQVARSYKGDIKPEWIKSISYATRDLATGDITWHTIDPKQWKKIPHKKAAAEPTVYYIPMWLSVQVSKYDPAQARDPKGTSTGGQFAATGRDANGLNPNTGQRIETGAGWRQSVTGEEIYEGVSKWMDPNYVPPKVQHQTLKGGYLGVWGGSHSGSQTVTGASAKQMGIEGYEDHGAAEEAVDLAKRMVQAIADDTVGSEEVLHHVFENVRHTEFKVGDTMQLPLTATSGDVGLSYGIRSDADNQRGQPVVFEFEKGTQMVGYSITRERDLEDIGQPSVEAQFKEQGYLWNEAIVAGAFEVVAVREAYMGSQHFNEFYHKPENAGKTIQIYGKVVRLKQVKTFDPKTGKWVSRG